MHVLVSVDMEGTAGVVSPDDIRPGHPEFERSRGYTTDEANAAVRGVLSAHPDATVLVADAHADFRTLIPDRLDRRAMLVRGAPRRHAMISGIQSGTDAVCFVGYHGRAGTATSVLAHTISGGVIASVRCNGRELGEFGLNAALAGRFRARTVLATGDDTLAREAADLVPGITTVEVKLALGNRAAIGLHPTEACARIEQGARDALLHPPEQIFTIDGPVDLEVEMHRPVMAELACLVPEVRLLAPTIVGRCVPDIDVALDLIEVFVALARSI
ncbi:M55 family metallopeptidase [Actinomycetospora sp. NBRC 106378]|uniref:M55 family metallopeptidase n=1 Tax=Actinomycetospora sp. NBRC 106378 TaxID=3032208 RepID=UPI0024A49084|nr:M55 family metallopeptidase [Actinomycetospora sp. NBRC 106378]GLZ52627.1 D-aminopeptidase DppA [Actinomycetospora sp. NBRC 106378]